jgi:hypothetical protein
MKPDRNRINILLAGPLSSSRGRKNAPPEREKIGREKLISEFRLLSSEFFFILGILS